MTQCISWRTLSVGVISLALLGEGLSPDGRMREPDRMTPQSVTATPADIDSPNLPRPAGAAEALAELMSGNRRFVGGRPRYGHRIAAAAAASGGQQPYAVVVGCIDSRVPLEAVFDQNFGSICVVRSGAAVLDQAVVGSVEFAVGELGVPLVMVLGHERCGAIAATIEAVRSGRIPAGPLGYLVEQISSAVLAAGLHRPDVAQLALRKHVASTVARLHETDALRAAVEGERAVRVVGAVYDLDTGVVDLI
jgi:carbonic anhydrase